MACGTPAYATSVSGVPDVVRKRETGFLMEHVDDETIATRIERILKQDATIDISRNARKRIEMEYSFVEASRRWRGILDDLTRH